MVQVYQQPLCKRHHSGLLSAATLFCVAAWGGAVVLSLLLAYATGGFWPKVAYEVAQPLVHYSGDALLVLEGAAPGQEQVWSTSAALQAVLPGNRLSASVQVGEEDANHDGKPDLIRFVLTAQSRVPVHSVKLLLQMSYSLQGAAKLRMHGLAYVAASSPLPGSSLTADGQLRLQQSVLVPAGGINVLQGKPLLDDSLLASSAQQGDALLALSSMLASYQQRNATTFYELQYPVWKAGSGQQFTLDVSIRVPPSQVYAYRPGAAEMLKWGWVQFVATFWLLSALLAWMEGRLFGWRVLETRVISDVAPRQQRF